MKNTTQKPEIAVIILSAFIVLIAGCVEKTITINTAPAGAVVYLNDEEIGSSPVTTTFNWYGDYRVYIVKPGCEILNTHKELERPLHDVFPFDFFAEVLWPGRIVDHYEWTFQLDPLQPMQRQHLIKAAENLRNKAESNSTPDQPKDTNQL